MLSSFPPPRPTESTHHRLIDFVKTALIKIFVSPYATVCELYCGKVPDEEKWDAAQIGHYIGIDVVTSGVSEVREAWESRRKAYTSEFLKFDPCVEDVDLHWKNKENQADVVFCMQHLPLCVETEEQERKLLQNVSSLLKPGGYFVGITPDSSTIWAKYQKNVEAYHNKGGAMKPNIVPNCIRSESYMITFEVEEEKFPFFGKKYQLKFSGDMSAETHCLVHFPSLLSAVVNIPLSKISKLGYLQAVFMHDNIYNDASSLANSLGGKAINMIRLARDAGLEYVEIQNLTEFYDDYRAQLSGLLVDSGHNLVDQRGRLLQRSFDVLGLYTTFIFQKPDPDIAPPLMTPIVGDGSHNHDEDSLMPQRDWPVVGRRDDEKNVQSDSSGGLGKISEQKGILGPGPAELRFPEAL